MDIKTQVYSGMWMTLAPIVKDKIAKDFGIPKNGATHVVDGLVQSDGFLDKDLAKLNVGTMQKYLESEETDLFKLWNDVIRVAAYGKGIKGNEPVVEAPIVAPVVEVTKPKKSKK